MHNTKRLKEEINLLAGRAMDFYMSGEEKYLKGMAYAMYLVLQAFKEYIDSHNKLHGTILKENKQSIVVHEDTRKRLAVLADHLDLKDAHPKNSK